MSDRVPANAGPRPSRFPDDTSVVGLWGPEAWIDTYDHLFPSRVRLAADPNRFDHQLERCDVVVVVAPDLSDADAAQLLRTLDHPDSPPVVLCTENEAENLTGLLHLRADELFLLDRPELELAAIVSRMQRERNLVQAVAEILPSLDSLPPTVAHGIRLLLDEAMVFATATSLDDAPYWSFRSRVALARRLGCEPHYISRNTSKAGFRTSPLLRWMTFLVALQQRRRGRQTWAAIARSLGFSTSSDWTHFVERLTGLTPIQVEDQGRVDWWIQPFRESVLILPNDDPVPKRHSR